MTPTSLFVSYRQVEGPDREGRKERGKREKNEVNEFAEERKQFVRL